MHRDTVWTRQAAVRTGGAKNDPSLVQRQLRRVSRCLARVRNLGTEREKTRKGKTPKMKKNEIQSLRRKKRWRTGLAGDAR